MQEARLGLIGAGRWGRRYIQTIANLQGIHLRRVSSGNPVSRCLVPAGCDVIPDWRAVIAAGDIDGVIVATPPSVHFAMARAAIEAGMPVLVEKPLTLSLDEAQALSNLARRHACLVVVGHTHLYSPAYRALKERAAAFGPVRRIVSVGGNWGPFRRDMTPMWDYAPHDLAMCLDLLGAGPSRVAARVLQREYTAEGYGEVVAIDLAFPSGVQAVIEVGNIMTEKHRRFEVRFDQFVLVYDDLALAKLTVGELGPDGALENVSPIHIAATPPIVNQVRSFSDSIAAAQTSDSSLELGVAIVEVLARCEGCLADRGEAGPPPQSCKAT